MSAAQLERPHEHLQRLRLFKVRERLEALLQDATTKDTSYADFLDGVLTEEVASKTAKHVTMRTRLARFPFVKSLETFDFSYQPSLDKKQLRPRMVAGRAPALITDAPLPGRMQGSEARESMERRAASENAPRATTINDFAELETA